MGSRLSKTRTAFEARKQVRIAARSQRVDRFGIASLRPAPLRQLPPLPAEAIDPDISGGDICVHSCSDDPQVAFHAVRNLARIGRGAVVIKWSQLGFGRTSTTTREQDTPRNLMGSRTAPTTSGPRTPRRSPISSGLATRHRRGYGAHLHGHAQDPLASGDLLGTKILRRGYSFTDGFDEVTGRLDAGLFFICFQRDPEQFERIQRNLSSDILNEYLVHTSSAVFAVPPGVSKGGFVGEALLEMD